MPAWEAILIQDLLSENSVSRHVAKTLIKHGITTGKQLMEKDSGDLLKLKGIGKRAIKEIDKVRDYIRNEKDFTYLGDMSGDNIKIQEFKDYTYSNQNNAYLFEMCHKMSLIVTEINKLYLDLCEFASGRYAGKGCEVGK